MSRILIPRALLVGGIFLTGLLLGAKAFAQNMPETAPPPKAIATKPQEVCASLQKEWDAKANPSSQNLAEEGKKLCAEGRYAEGALKLRQAMGK